MKILMFLLAILSLGTLCWAGSARQDAVNRLNHAATVLHEIMDAPDQRIPDWIMKRAKCVAVIPHLIKGGFVFGAEHGKGVATCRTAKGWSAPAFIQIGGGSWGTQIGVEAVDLVMVIKSEKGMQKLLSSKFEIGRDASVAVGPVGRHSSENTDVKLDTMILTYSRAKGAFLGMSASMSSISFPLGYPLPLRFYVSLQVPATCLGDDHLDRVLRRMERDEPTF